LPATLAGIVLGGWAISGLSDYWLKKAIGAAGLVFALFQLAAMWRPAGTGTRGGGLAARAVGLLVGFASSVAHSGGVILGTYLVGLGLGNVAVVATGAAVVAVADVLKLATYWAIGFVGWSVVVAALAATPLIYIGAWVGVRLNAWLPRRWLGLELIAIAILGSLKLLVP
jgi:uncharacterized membrane protein YfcA